MYSIVTFNNHHAENKGTKNLSDNMIPNKLLTKLCTKEGFSPSALRNLGMQGIKTVSDTI